jgi:hypothetical protein
VSSAILYVAIVAIWAVFLVPRWIHRPHSATHAPAEIPGENADAETETGEDMADSYAAPTAPPPRLSLGRLAAWRPRRRHGQESEEIASSAGEFPSAVGEVPPPPGDFAPPSRDFAPSSGEFAQPPRGELTEASPGRPPISRAHILQARRRMLTMLVTLLAVAAVCTVGKLIPWWACVPPAGMLGMYLLLLREAALADAEQARWRAEDAALRIRAARQLAPEEWEAQAPEPTAEIIDISGRVGDQLYDQYADARAIGD